MIILVFYKENPCGIERIRLDLLPRLILIENYILRPPSTRYNKNDYHELTNSVIKQSRGVCHVTPASEEFQAAMTMPCSLVHL